MEKYYTLQLCGYDYYRFIIGCSGETERYITENHRLLNFTDKTELLKYAENNNIDISYEESIDFYTPDIYDFSQILKIVRISINISKTFDIPYIGNEERFSELYKTMESFTKKNIKQEDINFKWKPAEFKMITELIRDSMHIIHASFTPIPVNYYLVAVSDSGYYSYEEIFDMIVDKIGTEDNPEKWLIESVSCEQESFTEKLTYSGFNLILDRGMEYDTIIVGLYVMMLLEGRITLRDFNHWYALFIDHYCIQNDYFEEINTDASLEDIANHFHFEISKAKKALNVINEYFGKN